MIKCSTPTDSGRVAKKNCWINASLWCICNMHTKQIAANVLQWNRNWINVRYWNITNHLLSACLIPFSFKQRWRTHKPDRYYKHTKEFTRWISLFHIKIWYFFLIYTDLYGFGYEWQCERISRKLIAMAKRKKCTRLQYYYFFLKFVDCVRMAIYKAYAHSHTYRYTQRIITKHSTKVTPIPNNDEKSKTFL